MKLLLLAATVGVFQAALATNFVSLPLSYDRTTRARVLDVKLLSAQIVVESPSSAFENRSLQLELGVTAVASACETMGDFQVVSAQRSLQSYLNPTDSYYRVRTSWKPGCATGSQGPTQYLKLTLKYFIDQRRASEQGKPWPAPQFYGQQTQFLSFDAGMDGGFNFWKLYRLDFSDLTHPSFQKLKTYSYVQGEVTTR